jgi:hypothetical protein
MHVLEDFLAPKNMTADGVALKFAERVQMLYALSLPSQSPPLLPARVSPVIAACLVPQTSGAPTAARPRLRAAATNR